jgi:hypothetical protein
MTKEQFEIKRLKQLSRINVALLRHIHRGSHILVITCLQRIKRLILANEKTVINVKDSIQGKGRSV